MNSSLKRKIYWGSGIGFLIYIAIAFLADLEEILAVGGTFPWVLFPLIMALALGNFLIRSVRWHMYLRAISIKISLKDSAVVFFSGLAMSVTPGKFGELLKAQYIKNINGTQRRKTAPVIVAERLTDLIGVLVLASFGIFRFNYGEVVFYVVLAVIVISLIVISSRSLSLWCISLLKPVPFLGKRVKKIEEAYHNISALTQPFRLLTATLLSVVAWSFEGFGFYLVINSLGLQLDLQTALFIYAFAILVGAVSMLPGGLGATEGTMAGLLVLLNVAAAQAVLATLITRLATLWFAVALGVLCSARWYRLLEGAENSAELKELSLK